MPTRPMTRSRSLIVLLLACLGGSLPCIAAGDDAGPAATAQGLCDSLLASMKAGTSMSFPARVAMLAPEIRKDFDLDRMTRIVVGPLWKELGDPDRQSLTVAFSDYSIANYAQRFRSYSGERFEVDPAATSLASGDTVVHTRLFTGGPDPVQLDYLMRRTDGQWKIIDVFLNGTISELAARRSEYSMVLRTGGAPALADLLRKKSVDLGN